MITNFSTVDVVPLAGGFCMSGRSAHQTSSAMTRLCCSNQELPVILLWWGMSPRELPMASHRYKMWTFLMISDSHKLTCKQRKWQNWTRWQMYKLSCELKCRNVAVFLHGCWIHHWEWAFPQLISISTSCFIRFFHNEARRWARLCHFRVPTGGATVTRKSATRDYGSPGNHAVG